MGALDSALLMLVLAILVLQSSKRPDKSSGRGKWVLPLVLSSTAALAALDAWRVSDAFGALAGPRVEVFVGARADVLTRTWLVVHALSMLSLGGLLVWGILLRNQKTPAFVSFAVYATLLVGGTHQLSARHLRRALADLTHAPAKEFTAMKLVQLPFRGDFVPYYPLVTGRAGLVGREGLVALWSAPDALERALDAEKWEIGEGNAFEKGPTIGLDERIQSSELRALLIAAQAARVDYIFLCGAQHGHGMSMFRWLSPAFSSFVPAQCAGVEMRDWRRKATLHLERDESPQAFLADVIQATPSDGEPPLLEKLQ